MCQAEAIVASAPVISWDVNALVDTAAVIFSRTLVHICREREKNKKACESCYTKTRKQSRSLKRESSLTFGDTALIAFLLRIT